MSWIAIGVTAAVAPSIYKGVVGISQSNQANGIKPLNPGYQMNEGVINNAKTLSDNYGNYQVPGYSNMVSNINTNYANAFESGTQGASTGGDILDLATKMAYGKNNAFNQLGQQNAVGKQNALTAYLNANAAAGQQYVDKNAYDRQQYAEQLKQKAALTQAGAANTYGAVDSLAGVAAKYGFSQIGTTTPPTMGQVLGNPNLKATPPDSGITNMGYTANGDPINPNLVVNNY